METPEQLTELELRWGGCRVS